MAPPPNCATEFILAGRRNSTMRWPMDRVLYRIMLVIILIFGVIGIFLPPYIGITADHGTLSELGKAFLIAGVLGFTIEPWMRKALARDVFSAAFGYYMPDDFKTEIVRIASNRIICTRHTMDIRLQEVDDQNVRVCTTVERYFENIGATPALLRAMTWIDEWGYPEKTTVVRCEISEPD